MNQHPSLIFSTRAYVYLRDELVRLGGGEAGRIESYFFPDGERYLRVESHVARRDVVIVGGTISDADTLELYDLAFAIARAGAASTTLVIPYFGYSTMERATRPGEVVTAKARARLFSSIPRVERVVLLDLHVEGIAHYFEGTVRPHHVYAKPIIHAAARRLGGSDFVLACTDAGRAKWVESLANDLGVSASFVFKRRLDGATTHVTAVSAQVKDKRVIIYDDMIRTGGSLVGAARAYRAAGATEISAIATHGLFPGDALAQIQETGLFAAMVCTDSHPRALSLAGPFLTLESVAPVLLPALVS